MGCDIHAFAEVKIKGVWYVCDRLETPRNYELFAKIAGVRGGEDEGLKPRGLPADLSIVAQLEAEAWEGDAHSHTWLSWAEVQAIGKWFKKQYPQSDEPFGYRLGYDDALPDGMDDVRLVCWFDN